MAMITLFTSLTIGCTSETIGNVPDEDKVVVNGDNVGISTQTGSPSTDEKQLLSFDDWSTGMPSVTDLTLMKIPREAKALFITGWTVGTGEGDKFKGILNLLDETELNALVIDVKDDTGYVTYPSEVPMVKKIGSDRNKHIADIDKVMKVLEEKNIYTIARIVAFKDPFLPGARPDLALQRKEGGVWTDRKGVAWVDPYQKEVWDYNIAVAKEAAKKGFKEIQFDYVRFPENGKKVDDEVAFNDPQNRSKSQLISDFLAYAKKELEPYNVFVSADVFGLVTSIDDMEIGQRWELVTPHVDYISPMMYPSHYGPGNYGFAKPDLQPYGIIKQGIIDALARNEAVKAEGKEVAIIRPWYQDFTATYLGSGNYIEYGPEEVKAQIKAAKELGVTEYLIWNPGNRYSEGAWR